MNEHTQPPVHVDIPDNYVVTDRETSDFYTSEHAEHVLDTLRALHMSDGDIDPLQTVLQKEEALQGHLAREDMPAFVERRANLFFGIHAELEEQLPALKEEMAQKIADYFGGPLEDRQSFKTELLQRVAGTQQIRILDSLDPDLPEDMVGLGGVFYHADRQIGITTNTIVDAMLHNREAAVHELRDNVVAHELLHGFMVTAKQADKTVGNGVLSIHYDPSDEESLPDAHGNWLNEAVLEDFRQELMKTPETTYKLPVAILRLIDQFDYESSVSIIESLRIAALTGEHKYKGEVFGWIEEILGPTGIEDVEALVGQYNFESRYASQLPEADAEAAHGLAMESFEREFAKLFPAEDRAGIPLLLMMQFLRDAPNEHVPKQKESQ